MTTGLTLIISTLSVNLNRFSTYDLPRVRVNVPEVKVTSAGTTVGDGTFYEPKHMWDVSVYVNETEKHLLKAIWAEFDRRRRLDVVSNSPDILVYDETDEYPDSYPRRRVIVPGTTQVNLPNDAAPVSCAYFAVFRAWFTQEPRFTIRGIYWEAKFTLFERGVILA
jgi:hypothetical protein